MTLNGELRTSSFDGSRRRCCRRIAVTQDQVTESGGVHHACNPKERQ